MGDILVQNRVTRRQVELVVLVECETQLVSLPPDRPTGDVGMHLEVIDNFPQTTWGTTPSIRHGRPMRQRHDVWQPGMDEEVHVV